jgi:hypothetical protein
MINILSVRVNFKILKFYPKYISCGFYPNIGKMGFATKFNTTIKPIKGEVKSSEEILTKNPKTPKILEKTSALRKDKTIYTNDKTGLDFLASMNESQLKDYYKELKSTYLTLEDKPMKYMSLMYFFHTLPLLYMGNQILYSVWVYQVFWATTGMGLIQSVYEFYSTNEEKKILNRNLKFAYLILFFKREVYYCFNCCYFRNAL